MLEKKQQVDSVFNENGKYFAETVVIKYGENKLNTGTTNSRKRKAFNIFS